MTRRKTESSENANKEIAAPGLTDEHLTGDRLEAAPPPATGYAAWAVQAGVDKVFKGRFGAVDSRTGKAEALRLNILDALEFLNKMTDLERSRYFVEAFQADPDLQAGLPGFNRLVDQEFAQLDTALREAWRRKLKKLTDEASVSRQEIAQRLFRDIVLVHVQRFPDWMTAGRHWAEKLGISPPYNVVKFQPGDDPSQFGAQLTDADYAKLESEGVLLLKPRTNGRA